MMNVYIFHGKVKWCSVRFLLVGLLFSLCISKSTVASDIKEVLPLTSKVIMIHFDDGSVTYPNSLSVNRLVTADADNVAKWSFTSTDDADFWAVVNPSKIGRKTRGTEFVKDVP